MEFAIRTGQPARLRTGCLVAGLFEDGEPGPVARDIDEATDGLLVRLRKRRDLPRKAGETVVLHDVSGLSAQRVLLVGCGKAEDYGLKGYRKSVSAAVAALVKLGAKDAVLALAPGDAGPYEAARHAVEAASHALYRFDELKSRNKDPQPVLARLDILTAGSGAPPRPAGWRTCLPTTARRPTWRLSPASSRGATSGSPPGSSPRPT